MSAFNTGALHPLAPSGASTEKRVYEPSMEEILASIRRIIADDQSLPGRGAVEHDERPRAAPPHVTPPIELRRTSAPSELVEPPRHEPVDEPPRVGESLRVAEPPHVGEPLRADERAPDPVAPVPTNAVFERVDAAAASNAGPHPAPAAHGTIAAPQYAMPDRAPAVPPPSAPIASEPLIPVARDGADAPREMPQQAAPPQPSLVAEAARSYPMEPELTEPDIAEPGVREPDLPSEPPAAPPSEAPSLFSAATDTSVAAAFNLLAASRLADNSDEIMNLVRDMIRPLLRNWLDDNLPSMVERMVRAEIERVARGGR